MATGAQTAAHHLDAPDIPVATDLLLVDQDQVSFGEISLTAIHLVGHTPGSIALLYQDPAGPPHLFTGDCLFPGGVGNTEKMPSASIHLLAMCPQNSLTVYPMKPGYTPGTAMTPISAVKDRNCLVGASAAGSGRGPELVRWGWFHPIFGESSASIDTPITYTGARPGMDGP